MSVMDQAFIRAYGCHDPEATTGLCDDPATPSEASAGSEEPPKEEPRQGPAAPHFGAADTRDEAGFRALLQVDRVEWPSDVAQLGRAAGGILEALAEQLRSSAAEGRNVIALGNCHRGDGSTTLLLCIARCLSGRGLKVAVVDADFRRPRLARRLGILPETGWDEVLDGRATLGDAVIESLRDRLAILPLREPPEGRSGSPPAADGLGSSLAALRLHFDVVLIDLGSCRREHPLLPRSDSPNSWIDRVLLVRNVRTTPTSDLTEACRRVRSSGIGEVGVVENFV